MLLPKVQKKSHYHQHHFSWSEKPFITPEVLRSHDDAIHLCPDGILLNHSEPCQRMASASCWDILWSALLHSSSQVQKSIGITKYSQVVRVYWSRRKLKNWLKKALLAAPWSGRGRERGREKVNEKKNNDRTLFYWIFVILFLTTVYSHVLTSAHEAEKYLWRTRALTHTQSSTHETVTIE